MAAITQPTQEVAEMAPTPNINVTIAPEIEAEALAQQLLESAKHAARRAVAAASEEAALPVDSECLECQALESEEALVASGGESQVRWVSALCVEGIWTGDGRFITPGAIDLAAEHWPLTFMVLDFNGGGGHDGAEVGGRIDQVWRVENEDGTATIWGTGVFDANLPGGATGLAMWESQSARGVSVDLDAIEISADSEISPFGGGEVKIAKARLRGATMCNFAAFIDARITFVESDGMPSSASVSMPMEDGVHDGEHALVASAAVGVSAEGRFVSAVTMNPSKQVFARKEYDRYTPLTISKDGVLSGHCIPFGSGQCHIGFTDKCVPLPQSTCSYRYARAGGHVLTSEGDMVPTARLFAQFTPGRQGHAPGHLPAAEAIEWYENMSAVVADAVPYDDEFGIQLQGRIRPGVLTDAQLIALRGADWSPDWRYMHETRQRECLTIAAVNTSGGPSRYEDMAAVDFELGLVASAGVEVPEVHGSAYIVDGEVMTLVASAGGAPRRRIARQAQDIADLESRVAELEGTVERFAGLAERVEALAGFVEPQMLAAEMAAALAVLDA